MLAATFRHRLQAAVTVAVLLLPSAQAALLDRGSGVVYDSETGLDWERSPNTASVNWHQANDYISALTLDGGGWRMPTVPELFDLYDHISAATGCVDCTGDQGPFDDLQLGYWTTLQYWGGQPGAFYVGFWSDNYKAGLFQTSSAWVWAMREGSPVPEPGSLPLVWAALLAVALARRHRG